MEIVIRRDGSVGEVTILQGLAMGLNERAIQAVQQWRFSPARMKGDAGGRHRRGVRRVPTAREDVYGSAPVVITVVSLVFALVVSVMAWRTSQDEKRRAAARVARAGGRGRRRRSRPPRQRRRRPRPPDRPDVTSANGCGAWRSPAAPDHRREAIGAAIAGGGRPPATPSGNRACPWPLDTLGGFLGTPNRVPESGGHQRWLAAAAAVLAVVLGGSSPYGSATARRRRERAHSRRSAPLELLSLRHERDGVNLSVSGLVRNPPAAPVVERLSAVVFLFDQQGTFVTSAKAPVDFLNRRGRRVAVRGQGRRAAERGALPRELPDRGRHGAARRRRGEPPVTAPVALTRRRRRRGSRLKFGGSRFGVQRF